MSLHADPEFEFSGESSEKRFLALNRDRLRRVRDSLTGRQQDRGLTGLSDKRVAVIGTGATAVQCVPHLGETAQRLYVFQRTPSSIDARNNASTESAPIAASIVRTFSSVS